MLTVVSRHPASDASGCRDHRLDRDDDQVFMLMWSYPF